MALAGKKNTLVQGCIAPGVQGCHGPEAFGCHG